MCPHEAAQWRAAYEQKGHIMSGNKPTLIAYSVKEREGKKDFWMRIGAAWSFEHNGRTGFTVQLDALPIDGRIVLSEPKADSETKEGGAQ
jgi:hypothetical protein